MAGNPSRLRRFQYVVEHNFNPLNAPMRLVVNMGVPLRQARRIVWIYEITVYRLLMLLIFVPKRAQAQKMEHASKRQQPCLEEAA